MTLTEAKTRLKVWEVKYLIIGFKSDGIRGIPINYIEEVVTVGSDEDLLEIIQIFEIFRVFTVGGGDLSQEEIISLRCASEKEKQEKKDKAMLAKLLKKYPQ